MSILPNDNGNLYSQESGQSTNKSVKTGNGRMTKYNKYMDMPFTMEQKRQVKQMTNKHDAKRIDTMAYDKQYGYGSVGTVWYIAKVSTIPQGAQARIGDSVTVRDVEVRYTWELPASASYNFGVNCRYVLFQYYMDDLITPPTDSILFESPDPAPAILANYSNPRTRQFKILYDETVSLGYGAATTATRVVKVLPGRKKINYTAGGFTGDGNIYFAVVADQTSSLAPAVAMTLRVNYYDA